MFRQINEMTHEEKQQEISDIEKLLKISASASVDGMLSEEIDTSLLQKYNITLTPNGQFFSCDNQGFLSELMEAMYNGRTVYKRKALDAKKQLEAETEEARKVEIRKRIARYDNLQLAKKVSLNSAYGALGNQYFRFFDIRQATAITTAGQLSIRWIEAKLNEYMNRILKTENEDYVIASDTDSIYLSLGRLVDKAYLESNPSATTAEVISFMDKICESKIQPFIDKSYDELARYTHAFGQKMQMKREALCDQGIWTAKKRYILNVHNNEGVAYKQPKIKVMGLEVKKSSTPAFFRDKMEECIRIMLNATQEELIKYIDDVRETMKTAPIEDISFPRGVNGLQKFSDSSFVYSKGCPIHVRGSLIFNDMLKKHKLTKIYDTIKEGEKIKFIYMKEPNPSNSNVIAFASRLPKEFGLEKYVDHDTQFEKAFLEPIKIITKSINWKTEEISSLESFFV